ncbi:MAG: hypothetical protein WEC13_02970, partial [Burkholderiales bacterium]
MLGTGDNSQAGVAVQPRILFVLALAMLGLGGCATQFAPLSGDGPDVSPMPTLRFQRSSIR